MLGSERKGFCCAGSCLSGSAFCDLGNGSESSAVHGGGHCHRGFVHRYCHTYALSFCTLSSPMVWSTYPRRACPWAAAEMPALCDYCRRAVYRIHRSLRQNRRAAPSSCVFAICIALEMLWHCQHAPSSVSRKPAGTTIASGVSPLIITKLSWQAVFYLSLIHI